MSEQTDEKKVEQPKGAEDKPEIKDEELDKVSGGTGVHELGERGINPDLWKIGRGGSW